MGHDASKGWQTHDHEQPINQAVSTLDHDMLGADQAEDEEDDGMREHSDFEMGLEDNLAEGPTPEAEQKKQTKSDGTECTVAKHETGKMRYREEGKQQRK